MIKRCFHAIPTALLMMLPAVLFSSCSLHDDGTEISASGTIEAVDVHISSKVSAEVDSILIEEGSKVQRGDTLFIIDHTRLDLQLTQTQAAHDFAEAQLQLLLNGARAEDIAQAEEALRQAAANLKTAELNYNRTKDLYAEGSITEKQRDDAEAAYTVASAQYNSAQQAYNKIKRLARPEEIRAGRAKAAQAEAAVDLVRKTISDCFITSPVDGIVTEKAVETGELVLQGSTVAQVSKVGLVNLMIYVTEPELGKAKIGQEAKVYCDSYPKRAFEGKVVYISPEAEFTPKNIQTKEDRVKLVFGVKIEIDNPEGVLKPGMPADAVVKVD
jgi:HlyD family secretion protein